MAKLAAALQAQRKADEQSIKTMERAVEAFRHAIERLRTQAQADQTEQLATLLARSTELYELQLQRLEDAKALFAQNGVVEEQLRDRSM